MQHGDLALIGLSGAVLALVGSAFFAWTQWRFGALR